MRRHLLKALFGATAGVYGGLPPRRPDQHIPAGWPGMLPAPQNVIVANRVIVTGPNDGLFVYSPSPGPGKLVASIAATAGTDSFGNVYPAGVATFNGFGAVINLLSTSDGAFFQYADHGSSVQGALILSVASAAGTDPVTATSYTAGLTGSDPVFGSVLKAVGATLDFFVGVALSQAGRVNVQQGSGASSPYIVLFAPEQGVSGHLVMLMQGTSPDGTHPGQLLVASEPTGFSVPVPVTSAMIEWQGASTNTPVEQLVVATAALAAFAVIVAGDTSSRFNINATGQISWGPGNAARDCNLGRQAAGILQVTSADFDIATLGKGLRIKEGANARMGIATLVAGTVTVPNTSVTANTRTFYAVQTAGGTQGFLSTALTAGTSFTIRSSSVTETSTVAWFLMEPG